MHVPPNWPMELVLSLALFVSTLIVLFALQDATGDRTRFTLERSEVPRMIGERRLPLLAEETALGR